MSSSYYENKKLKRKDVKKVYIRKRKKYVALSFDEFNRRKENTYLYYDIDYGADEFFTYMDKVQLGDRMWVEISIDTTVKGLGVFEIPVTLKVKRSGISEVYWRC